MSVLIGAESAPSMADPDQVDIRACLAGNADAYGRLIDRHEARIAARMWRLCRDRSVCEELVQDVFVKAYFNLSSYGGRGAFIHWLHRIASRVACDYFRRTSRQPVQVPIEGWDQVRQQPEALDAGKAAALVHELLAQLGPKDRLVMTMIYLEDCSVEEVTGRTGWNPTAVRMRVSRARNRLRRIVERKGLLEGRT